VDSAGRRRGLTSVMKQGYKRCSRCGEEKPVEGFHRCNHSHDGRKRECRECARERVRIYREKNRERLLVEQRASYRASREQTLAYQQRYRTEHPERKRVRGAVERAVRSGKLQRQPCQVCGVEPAEAHHPNYDRALDVQWLCRSHHRQIHAGSRDLQRHDGPSD
jgi:hypothetical protein